MATTRQKEAARRNIKKAQQARSSGSGRGSGRRGTGLSTAEKNDLPGSKFAFPDERKEPLTDARHVRNAIARFDQVEGVSDAERDRAWKRIRAAAREHGVEVSARGWRDLVSGGRAGKPR